MSTESQDDRFVLKSSCVLWRDKDDCWKAFSIFARASARLRSRLNWPEISNPFRLFYRRMKVVYNTEIRS